MAWETRGGGRYYYRKRREGQHVYSEYVGSGPWAEALSAMEKRKREEKKRMREAEQRELEMWLEIDREVNRALETCSDILSATLLASGLHTHKGQWRRKRGRR